MTAIQTDASQSRACVKCRRFANPEVVAVENFLQELFPSFAVAWNCQGHPRKPE